MRDFYRRRVLCICLGLFAVTNLVGGCKSENSDSTQGQKSESDKKAAGGDSAKGGSEVQLSVAEQKGTIETVMVTESQEPDRLHFPGKIVLPDNQTWRVGVLTDGRIEKVYANLGDYVHKGQVLARMHSHDVHEAQAAYAMAVTERTRQQAAEALAQTNYERVQRLYGLRAASVAQTEQARQELANAKAGLQNAEIDVTRSKTHLEENLGIKAEISPSGRNENSELIPIVAPASGYVLQKNATPGTTVAPATDIFVLGNLSHLWMLASVGQEFLGELKVGQSTTVTLPGVSGQSFPGKISNLGQSFDPTTRRLQVRIDLEGRSEVLHPEMLANAEIAAGEKHPLILAEPDAVQQVNGQDVVFVRKAPDRFAVRPVRVNGSVNGKLVLAEGIRSGEEVVSRGSFLLKSQLLKASMQGD